MLHDALDITSGPTSIRWPNSAAPVVSEAEVGHGLHARQVQEGSDVCLIGVGKMLAACQEAARTLAADHGLSVSVWDPRVVRPLDAAMLDHALGHGLVVTAEDGLREGGIGSTIADELAQRSAGLAAQGRPLVRVLGVPVAYVPQGKADAILAKLGLDATGIVTEVQQLLTRS